MAVTKNFMLEIGVEELPAKLLAPITNHIKDSILNLLAESGIEHGDTNIAYTPRRLFIEIASLSAGSSDTELEIKGPPANIALKDGKPTQAALGFAAKNNTDSSKLFERDGYVYAKVLQRGVSSSELLETNLARIIAEVPGERFMRWADGSLKFSRPVLWIVALLGSDLLKINLEGLESSNISYGHRFLAPEAFKVKDAKQYISELAKRGIVLEASERKDLVRAKCAEIAKSLQAEIPIAEDLLDEIVNLVENPEPILCDFDPKFLEIPAQVLITVMAKHQRYFPVLRDGILMPYFVAVSNNPLKQARANIKAGNEKVIIPRFKDAEFFVQEDAKTTLQERLSKLEKINFQAGNMLQKSKRIEKIAAYLLEELKANYAGNPTKTNDENLAEAKQITAIKQAALLAKADLTTHLVFEFTELQGEIGGVYAAKQELGEIVAAAIGEHYKPRFAGDELPSNIGAKLISIADRLDTLVCFFAAGKTPKGSTDPFALRRQANGLLEIVLHSHLIINLNSLIDYAANLAEAEFGAGKTITKSRGSGENKKTTEQPEFDWNYARSELKEFLRQRLPSIFEIFHKDTVINKAILEAVDPLSDLNSRHMMTHLMYKLRDSSAYPSLVEAITRVMNIADRNAGTEVKQDKFSTHYESVLYQELANLDKMLSKPTLYDELFAAEELVKLAAPIKNFFDNVLVNDPDPEIKTNRHALVNYGASLFGRICAWGLLSSSLRAREADAIMASM